MNLKNSWYVCITDSYIYLYIYIWKRLRNQRSNCQHQLDHRKSKGIPEKKKIHICFIDYAKSFDCADHNRLWKIPKEMEIPDNLTSLLRNLHIDQEATVRNGHGKMNWLKIGKGVHRGWILSPCLFNLHAEWIMQNSRLDKGQAEIKTAQRNINNLRYVDDTILMIESAEELKSLLIMVKEESKKAGLKLTN